MKNLIKTHTLLQIAILLLLMSNLSGCKKFLDEKPKQSLAIASSLKDYQALMDRWNIININDAATGDASTTEIYLTDVDLNARVEEDQRLYTWQNNNVNTFATNDWFYTYWPVYSANTIINDLPKIEQNQINEKQWKSILGQAYLIRGRAFLNIAGTYCLAYDESTANTDLGIAIRRDVNFNEQSSRASIKESYEQIISDLKQAATLLPVQEAHVMRASKPAAYALLARTYLWMRNYNQAALYADSCLQLKNTLMDYNTMSTTAAFPFAQFNPEVIFSATLRGLSILSVNRSKISPDLYTTYEANDLRKVLFFKDNGNGSYSFKGSYDGSGSHFSGIATNEMYLTRAESYARQNKLVAALNDLNMLLINRYKKGTYIPLSIDNKETIISRILAERRKELVIRGLRWMDIKRLNKESAGINLMRTANGKTYNLSANSLRFAIPLPDDLFATSDLKQNQY